MNNNKKFIKENYLIMSAEEISKIINITPASVRRIAKKLGITKRIKIKNKFKEAWFDIPNYSKYMISNYARIKRKKDDVLIKQNYTKDKYKCIKLVNNNNKRKTLRVHRLMALVFIPNPLNKPEVNHIDGNKNNNKLYNLEWVTGGENQIHSYYNNLRQPANINYDIKHIDKICRYIELGFSNKQIIKRFNNKFNYQQIQRIRRKDTWKRNSEKYNF